MRASLWLLLIVAASTITFRCLAQDVAEKPPFSSPFRRSLPAPVSAEMAEKNKKEKEKQVDGLASKIANTIVPLKILDAKSRIKKLEADILSGNCLSSRELILVRETRAALALKTGTYIMCQELGCFVVTAKKKKELTDLRKKIVVGSAERAKAELKDLKRQVEAIESGDEIPIPGLLEMRESIVAGDWGTLDREVKVYQFGPGKTGVNERGLVRYQSIEKSPSLEAAFENVPKSEITVRNRPTPIYGHFQDSIGGVFVATEVEEPSGYSEVVVLWVCSEKELRDKAKEKIVRAKNPENMK